jgi:hypothetical protein
LHLTNAFAAGILISLLTLPTPASQESPVRVLRAGQWSAWIKVTAPDHGTYTPRAITHHQIVFRQGPQDKAPIQLFEEKSTGSVRIALRSDGLLFVQPVAAEPRLFLSDPAAPLILYLPPPRKWNLPFSPYGNIGNGGHLSFLGDILFYGRSAYPGNYLIGFVRIDVEKKQITENRLCVEVATEREPDAHASAAQIAGPAPTRVDDYVFWKNAGYQNAWYPDTVTGIWKERKTRILDLKTGEIITLEQVPKALLNKHRQRLSEFIEG